MPKTIRITALAALFAAAPLGVALADRAPDAEESAIISDTLLSEGYSSWSSIEWEDGHWEVDDAVAQDGEKHDLKLDQSFAIISTDNDDDDDARG
jgi:hypothetical protein